jgi:protein-L-isoaspartate(D-aspartate) O-methyltransferase
VKPVQTAAEKIRDAMAAVDRRIFLPDSASAHWRIDAPLDIGFGQTTSQPSLIRFILEHAQLAPGLKVLEIGTGCGYQTAILSRLGAHVFSVEIVEALAERARHALHRVEASGVQLRVGDGYGGWPEAAPFDVILIAAAAAKVPAPLLDQLAVGGRLLMPLESLHGEQLVLVTKLEPQLVTTQTLLGVRFVPLTGAQASADRVGSAEPNPAGARAERAH